MNSLTALDVSLSLGERQILRSVTLSVQAGAVVGLIGPNGAGKSSLLRVLAGLLAPDAGRVTLGEDSLASIPPW